MMLLAALLSLGAVGSAPHVAVLRCGGSMFRVESRSWTDSAAPSAPAAQSLSVKVGRSARRLVPLEPAPSVAIGDHRVLRSFLSSWACVRGDGGRRYVSLGYACAVEPGNPGDCAGDAEWFRLIDLRGRRLDAGLPRNGPAVDGLHERLGLARAFADGVAMTDVL